MVSQRTFFRSKTSHGKSIDISNMVVLRIFAAVLLTPIMNICNSVSLDCSLLNLDTTTLCGDLIVISLPSALNFGQVGKVTSPLWQAFFKTQPSNTGDLDFLGKKRVIGNECSPNAETAQCMLRVRAQSMAGSRDWCRNYWRARTFERSQGGRAVPP